MYAEIKDKLSSDADVAGYIVNETRELSLEDLMDHSDHSVKSWSVFTAQFLLYLITNVQGKKISIPNGPKKTTQFSLQ